MLIYYRQCCDANAFCACGSASGHYSCVCNEGYYGNGLKGHCHRKLSNLHKHIMS